MTSRFDLIGQVRRSIADETGEKVSRAAASVWVDRMCDAFVQKWEGVGPAYAVADSPDVARHLAHRWKGEDGKRLRDTIASYERGDIARLAMAEGWGVQDESEHTCPWMIEVASGNPEPDFPSDLVDIVECGAKIGPHPDYPGVEGATICENGHERLPMEIEYAPYGPGWQREQGLRPW